MKRPPFPDIDELLQRLLDEQIEPEEMERLQKAIREDPQVRDYYVDSMLVCAVLRRSGQVTGELSESDLIQALTGEGHRSGTKPFWQRFRLIAAILMFGAFVSASFFLFRHKTQGPAVGRLTSAYEAQWRGSHPRPGEPLYAGLYNLCEGVAKMELSRGISLLVEAPCQVELTSVDEVYLRKGRLVVVSSQAKGFRVRTLTALITDLGTEFGVIVYSDGSTEAHVLKGHISVALDPNKSNQPTSLLVNEGQATAVDATGQTIRDGLAARADLFLFQLPTSYQLAGESRRLNLADIVGGGNGRGTGKLDRGIDLGTGQVFRHPPNTIRRSRQNVFQPTPQLRGIDGVFVPNGALGAVLISSTGLTFSECPRTMGSYYGGPANSGKFFDLPSQQTSQARLNGISFGTSRHPALNLHPNAGITFDLDQIRQDNSDVRIERFTAVCGIPKDLPQTQFSSADVWVLLDGVVSLHLRYPVGRNVVEKVNVPIPAKTRFLTLVTTCSGRADYSWIFFGDPILEPAKRWVEALAVGNGRLGAMVFGGVAQERIQLNEDTLWAGGTYDPANPDALEALPKVRELIFAGKYREAHNLVGQKMMAKPLTQMPYQCVGDLLVKFPNANGVTDYRRDLNLDTAVATVAYTIDSVRYTREVFSSPVDQVIVVALKADKPGKVTFTASMKTPQKASMTVESPNTLVMQGVNGGSAGIAGALKYQARMAVKASGGLVVPGDGQITVTDADSALLLIAAATSYKSYKDVCGDPEVLTNETIAKAGTKSFDSLLKEHIAAHQKLFRRVTLDLGTTAAAGRPTDERIRDLDKDKDPQLAALYFQFGRYLLMSSSRPSCQPANLQGIWNESMGPPWGSKYTININTEMNYWPAEPTNLGECVEPLVSMVMDLAESGKRTAKTYYNADGWVTHHNTDLWRATAPIDGPHWGMWPMGGAWLCLHLWDHYDYSRDKEYLAKVYPAMKGAAQFFFDTLIEEPKHKWLVTCPSLSPENGHPFGTSICAGPTMDMQILRDLFTNFIRAAEILGVNEDFRKQAAATRARLAPNQIGSAGQLQEWLENWDMKAPEIHHRHVSHLYGLYPSDQIHVRTTPDLAAAARKSLEIRGDEATGWGIGWRLNLWARLHDAEHTYTILTMLLRPERTYPNMFDAHPPFQIDGNFGGTSGIAEMLLQSCAGEIELLPALPKAWPNGSVKGLRARGGFELDVHWKDSKLVNVTVRSLAGGSCRFRYGTVTRDLNLAKGQSAQWDGLE